MKKLLFIILVALTTSVFAEKYNSEFEAATGTIENPGQGMLLVTSRMEGIPYGAYYSRWSWADFEPEEGKYDWSRIEWLIQNSEKDGIPISFRIMCANYHAKNPYVTPEWVFKKGAKSKEFFWDKKDQIPSKKYTTMARITPYFDDPIFIQEHEKFIKALAKRYDGNPHIAFIDIGSYGNWGEWHTFRLGIKAPSPEIRKKYADMYLDNFKKTPLVFMSDDEKTLKYALDKNGAFPQVGIRRDGVGGPWHYKNWIGSKKYADIPNMGEIWKDKPVVLEFIANAGKQKDWSMRRAVDFIVSNHACLFNENWQIKPLSDADKALVPELINSLGARLFIENSAVDLDGRNLRILIKGQNIGNCKIYLPYKLLYELRASDGKVLHTFASSENPSQWQPGEFKVEDSFTLPDNLLRGGYSVVARLSHKDKIFRDFKFAVKNANPDGSITLAKISLHNSSK